MSKKHELRPAAVQFFQAFGIPEAETEFHFHPVRKWRFDFAWPEQKVALEVEGGVFIQGRHSRGSGMKKDMEKYNAAALLGWRVFRVTPRQCMMVETASMMKQAVVK